MKLNPTLVQPQKDKKCAKKNSAKNTNLSTNQAPPVLTPYTLYLNHSATATFADQHSLFLVYKWIFKPNQANSRYC